MQRKVLLVIMDGIGIGTSGVGDMVEKGYTPNLDMLRLNYPNINIKAHGTAVGLPSDDNMGNSEVGHNALGCGQIYAQGAKLVDNAIESGEIYSSHTWNELILQCKKNNSTFHFIGLLSDGKVHSDINHLLSMLDQAKLSGVSKVRIHILLDGRDVPPRSALQYVEMLEEKLLLLNNEEFDGRIASGGGRMVITMDRYEADWNMVQLGWETHVLGRGRLYKSATEAIIKYREEFDVDDQYLPPFVIGKDGVPVGVIKDGDSVIFYNYRGDRAIELSKAFDDIEFEHFPRGKKLDVKFSGMLQYDGDYEIPHQYLVNPPMISNTLTDLLVKHNKKQFAVSETQKYGHVTYFWNGNRSKKISEELETYCEIPSDKSSFDERPWMKACEITDIVIEQLRASTYDFIRCNYPNGDMVGHTGNLAATIIAVETVDMQLGRLMRACDEYGYTMIITADHGNSDEMIELDKDGTERIRTAHSLNPVPFIIYDKNNEFHIKKFEYGLANVAPTIAVILGIDIPKEWENSIL